MSGSNGFHPVANLSERQRCPLHPTKRKYTDGAEAGREAQKRSKDTKLPIEAYMCEGCGHYHLTKSSKGGNGPLPDGKFTVGEFRSMAPDHPVFSGNPADEPPIVPGDHETRLKFARRFLETNPEPTSEQLCQAIGGCTKDTLRRVMKDLGYRNTRGRYAHWVKDDRPDPEPTPEHGAFNSGPPPRWTTEPKNDVSRETSPDDRTPLDLSYDNDTPETPATLWHGGRDVPWREARVIENVERIRHVAVGDLLDSYAAAGFRLVLSLEDVHA